MWGGLPREKDFIYQWSKKKEKLYLPQDGLVYVWTEKTCFSGEANELLMNTTAAVAWLHLGFGIVAGAATSEYIYNKLPFTREN